MAGRTSTRAPKSWACLAALFILAPTLAYATQMHFRDVPLSEAVDEADLIAVVEVVRVQPGRQVRLRIREVIRVTGTARVPTSGVLDVYDRSRVIGALAAQMSRASGVRRSPLVRRLGVGVEPTLGQRYCVMLSRTVELALEPGPIWSTSISRAYVPAPCAEVRRLSALPTSVDTPERAHFH